MYGGAGRQKGCVRISIAGGENKFLAREISTKNIYSGRTKKTPFFEYALLVSLHILLYIWLSKK
jgi:hypothetical protein